MVNIKKPLEPAGDFIAPPSIRRILGIAFAIQLLLLSLTFPLSEVLGIKGLNYIDNPYHEYVVTVAADSGSNKRLRSYDPYFYAGKAAGLARNHGAKLPALAAALLSDWFSPREVWKIYVFAASLLASICLPLALILFRFERNAVAVGAALGLLLWWTGMFRWLHTAGLASFVLAAYASIPFTALIVQLIESECRYLVATIATGLAGAFFFFVHPLFPLPVIVFTTAYLSLSLRELRWKRFAIIATIISAIAILPNSGWLYDAFVDPPDPLIDITNHQRNTGFSLIFKSLFGIWDVAEGAKINPAIALAAVAGLVLARTDARRRQLLSYAIAGWFWACYAFTAGHISALGELTQPNRFNPVAYLFMAVPAAVGISRLLDSAGSPSHSQRRTLARGTTGIIGLVLATGVVELGREVSSADIGHYGQIPPQARDQGDYARYLLDFLARNTDSSARILFETSNARIHDGGHIAGLIALQSQRELIGGPYVQRGFAAFWDGIAFMQPIDQISPEKMQEYLDRYNIGWVVAHSQKSQAYFDRLPSATMMEQWKKIKTYKVERDHSFFFSGSGELVERRVNRLVFANVKGDPVILKYHYLKGMQTNAVEIAPVMVGDDPSPFVRITGAAPNLTIAY